MLQEKARGKGEVCPGPSWPLDLPLPRPCKGREVLLIVETGKTGKTGKTKD
jgi:hypothetical protein